MKLTIKSPHTEMTEAIRSYVDAKVGKLNKYFDGIHRGTVTLRSEGHRNGESVTVASAEIVFSVARGKTLVTEARHGDMYAAIDLAVDKMKRSLSRFNSKLKTRRSGGVEVFPSPLAESVFSGKETEQEEEEE